MEIYFHSNHRGQEPVYDWLIEMKKKEPKTFRRATYLLEYLRNNGEWIKNGKISNDSIKALQKTGGLWQLRIHDNRVLFFYYSNEAIIIANYFKKKRKTTPPKEIKKAQEIKQTYDKQ